MKLLKQNVYFYFWITAIVLIALSIYWLNFEDAVLDINVHDTYFVIHNSHILQLLAIIYSFLGFIYWLFQKMNIKLVKPLTQLHTSISIIIIPLYFICSYLLELFYPPSNFPLFDDTQNFQLLITVITLIGLLAQLLIIFNIIISLIKYFTYKT
jgi:cytochrome c oxidase subunit 1